MNVADRTRCTLTTDPVLNSNPGFPFHYCHKSGFFQVEPMIAPLTTVNVYFTWPGEGGLTSNGDTNGNRGDWTTVFAWCDNPAIVIMPRQIVHFPTGFANPTNNVSGDHMQLGEDEMRYYPGKSYRMNIKASGAGLDVKVFEGTKTSPGFHHALVDAGLFTTGSAFNLGYPTALVANALNYFNGPKDGRYYAIDNLKISRVELVVE